MTTMPPRPAHRRGDVVLVLFPHSDLRTAKLPPALVVQADNLQTGLPQVIVAMITSQQRRTHHLTRVGISLRSLPVELPVAVAQVLQTAAASTLPATRGCSLSS